MKLYKSGRPTETRPLKDGGKKVPHAPGEYRIINEKTRKVEYLGYSCDMNRRMKQHIKTGKISGENSIFAYKKADGRASRDSLAEHERKKIAKHSPSLNQRAGGAGRPFSRRKSKTK